MMAVVHDLAEAQGADKRAKSRDALLTHAPPVGDIAPREGIPKAEKRRLEAVRHYFPQSPRHHLPCPRKKY